MAEGPFEHILDEFGNVFVTARKMLGGYASNSEDVEYPVKVESDVKLRLFAHKLGRLANEFKSKPDTSTSAHLVAIDLNVCPQAEFFDRKISYLLDIIPSQSLIETEKGDVSQQHRVVNLDTGVIDVIRTIVAGGKTIHYDFEAGKADDLMPRIQNPPFVPGWRSHSDSYPS